MSPRSLLAWLTRAVVLVVFAQLLVGCAHTTRIESVPSGADVYVDDEYAGKTPVQIANESGPIGHARVEVRHDGEAARFDMMREGWSGAGVIAAVGAGVGAFALGGSALFSFMVVYVTVVVATVSGSLGAGGTFNTAMMAMGMTSALFMYVVGYGLMLSSPQIGLLVAGEVGRAPPERVVVDFKRRRLRSRSGLAVPLVGASSGFRPVTLTATDEE